MDANSPDHPHLWADTDEWAVYQAQPGLPAEGDQPEIPAEPLVLVSRGYADEDEAVNAWLDARPRMFDVFITRLAVCANCETVRPA